LEKLDGKDNTPGYQNANVIGLFCGSNGLFFNNIPSMSDQAKP
jgi:hypothetical protein